MSRVGRTMGTMDPAFLGTRPVPPDPNVRSVRQQAQSDLVVVPDVGRWLNARHDITTEDGERTVQTAEATRKLALGLTLTSAIGALDADMECAHGRLPTDPTSPCGCWPNEGLPIIEPEEEMRVTAITETHHGSRDTADPDAPHGYKADGTPRKRPAPSAEQMAAAGAARDAYFARRRAEKAEQAASVAVETPPAPAEAPEVEVEPDPTPAPVATGGGLIAGFVEQIDAQLRTIADLMAPLEDERDELLAARERLVGT